MEVKLTFLGTGTSQGVPVIACKCLVCLSLDDCDKRLRSSVLIESKGLTLVIDSGPDFRQQMLRQGVERLDAIIFTHGHKDHIAGTDDVRAFNYFQKKAMPLYGELRVHEALKRDFHYAFSGERYPGIPELELRTIDENPFEIDGLPIIPIRVTHMYLPVLGFRIGNITYITDANYISKEEQEKIKGSQYLIINALRQTEHPSHFTLSQAVELSKSLGIPNTLFTHISHQMGLHEKTNAELMPGMSLAYDGLSIYSE